MFRSRTISRLRRTTVRRRTLAVVPALLGLLAISVVAAPEASATNCFASGQSPRITNVKFTGTSTYTVSQYNVARSGATTEKVLSTVSRHLGSLTFQFGSCGSGTAMSTTAQITVPGVQLTDVVPNISAGEFHPKPAVGTYGWTFLPGVSAEGSGYYTFTLGGLRCDAGSSSLPGWAGFFFKFVPIPGGKIVSVAVSTGGSWLLNKWGVSTQYSGCTQPPNGTTGPELAAWKMARAANGGLTLPAGKTQGLAYSKYSSNASYCTLTSNIDCGLHYQTYIDITAAAA